MQEARKGMQTIWIATQRMSNAMYAKTKIMQRLSNSMQTRKNAMQEREKIMQETRPLSPRCRRAGGDAKIYSWWLSGWRVRSPRTRLSGWESA